MGKGVLIAEIISNEGVGSFVHLGGDGLITKQEALKVVEDVANGYLGAPKLAEDPTIFFVEGRAISIKLQAGKITAGFRKRKPDPKAKKKKRKTKRKI